MLTYTIGEILFILNSIYCVRCTYKHLSDPEAELKAREEALHEVQLFSKELILLILLTINGMAIIWGLRYSLSDISFYSFLGSQLLNAVIHYQLLYQTLEARNKHLYLAEVWSTLSWLIIACEIIAKQSLF